LSDQIFQKLKLKFFLLFKNENLYLLTHFNPTSSSGLHLPFIASSIYAKIIGVSYTQIACGPLDKNGQKWPKMVSSPGAQTQDLPESKK
jgi:hypothetical protein